MASSQRAVPHRRRGFDHLVEELSVAAGRLIPRYPLWLRLRTLGFDPERLDRAAATVFCGAPLEIFLAEYGVRLPARRLLRVRRNVQRFDPSFPTPYERMSALGD
jgi:hypothetical protein